MDPSQATILLADDEIAVRELAEEILANVGYRVISASNGEEAVRLFKENADKISLALLDVVMPIMNGPQAYEEIKKIKPDIKTIFCSGYTKDYLNLPIELTQHVELMAKPYSVDMMISKIKILLG